MSEQIEGEVLPSIPGDSWRDTTEVVPFAEDNTTSDATEGTTEALQALLADDENGQAQFGTDESTVFTEDEETRIRTLIREELAQPALEELSG